MTDPGRARPRNPWWIPPFFGRVPALEEAHLATLGVIVLAMMFENYDMGLINSALKHIAEDLGMAAGDTGYYLGAVRLGGVLTFLILPFADRLGRRRVLLAALVGVSAATLATAVCQTPWQFTAAQVVARGFLLTIVATSIVILVEEFPAAHRAWAIGIAMAVSGAGYGLAALLFGAIDVLPYGWRALYAFGALPLLMLPWFRRSLRETVRFEAERESVRGRAEGAFGSWWGPIRRLARSNPRRAAIVGGVGLLTALGGISVYQYAAYFVQEVHGWLPWQYSLMILGGGLLGIIGSVAAGGLADRIGRRTVGFLAFGLFPGFGALFFLGPGWALVGAFAGYVFTGVAGDVILRAFASELFPTSQRGTALGWLMLVQTAGWTLGLFLVGLWTAGDADLADVGRVVAGVSAAMALGGLCLLALPETRSLELEVISYEPEG